MVMAQVGNPLGVCAVNPDSSFICDVIADGANTVTVSGTKGGLFSINQIIVFRVKATGAVFGATARSITAIAISGFDALITYSGADIAVVPGTHGIYNGNIPLASIGQERSNLNGGSDEQMPFNDINIGNVESMKRVAALLIPPANLEAMSYNDLVYAARLFLHPTTVK